LCVKTEISVLKCAKSGTGNCRKRERRREIFLPIDN
jgi:hypothetical protein